MSFKVLSSQSLASFVNYCKTPLISEKTRRYTVIVLGILAGSTFVGSLLFPALVLEITLGTTAAATNISIFTIGRGILFRFQAEKRIQLADETGPDDEKFEHYKVAADLGHPKAQFEIGECYQWGFGTKRNLKNAFENYNLAANQDCTKAQFAVGYAYENELGVSRDLKKAFYNYKLAADKELPDALCRTGYLYYKGEGVEQDFIEANNYAKRAVELGCDDAKVLIELTQLKAENQAATRLRIISNELEVMKANMLK